jgi:hypothetical protein
MAARLWDEKPFSSNVYALFSAPNSYVSNAQSECAQRCGYLTAIRVKLLHNEKLLLPRFISDSDGTLGTDEKFAVPTTTSVDDWRATWRRRR